MVFIGPANNYTYAFDYKRLLFLLKGYHNYYSILCIIIINVIVALNLKLCFLYFGKVDHQAAKLN